MKKLFLILFLCGFFGSAFAQSMSDAQILQYVMQQKKLGKAESDIAQELLKKGATLEQIQKMRQQYASQLEKTGMGQAADSWMKTLHIVCICFAEDFWSAMPLSSPGRHIRSTDCGGTFHSTVIRFTFTRTPDFLSACRAEGLPL